MIDPSKLMDVSSGIGLDPGTTLMGAKKFLADHGFTHGFGDPSVKASFENFVKSQTVEGTYAGKSLKLGAGGRAAILKHKLIVSGKFGDNLNEISPQDWQKINEISRINYLKKYVLKK